VTSAGSGHVFSVPERTSRTVAAVVGHVEWIDFVSVKDVPAAGDIVEGRKWWEQAGGGGAVAACQLAMLASETLSSRA
jgi:hypothetical protein